MLSQFGVEHQQENFTTFLIVWTGFWFYFEYKVIYAFRWRKWGKEVLRLTEGKLSVHRQIGKRGMPRHYALDYIKNVRLFKDNSNSFFKVMNNSYWVVSGETLAFDYQGKTVVFGLELNDADAQAFCKWLKYNIDQRKAD
jgi:hypothetical protein